MRTHLTTGGCGRNGRKSDNANRVDCGHCRRTPEFKRAQALAIKAENDAFAAQTPRTVVPMFGAVNGDGVMECRNCQGVLWRERPRSLFSYHYVCEGCGTPVFPMTETGMCT